MLMGGELENLNLKLKLTIFFKNDVSFTIVDAKGKKIELNIRHLQICVKVFTHSLMLIKIMFLYLLSQLSTHVRDNSHSDSVNT